ncbi:MAG: adenosylcobalamin-dependent ribonucleoside-diphosphate reductase [Sedimentisphaerales bacterium]|nr:adenosylcobalamin-dependent ribonucleoside-diphosphate reductase [Sedimentisphaerales bacterium]
MTADNSLPPTNNIPAPPGEKPKLTDNALTVLKARYLIKDADGKCIETPAELFSRAAWTAASAEKKYGATPEKIKGWHKRFYDIMAGLKFLPNSPTLMNASRNSQMLSACFVLPVKDSIEEIFETIKQTALIQKAGGGTGFSLDELRPTGDIIKSSGGTTSGPISFWRVFSEATNAIQQGAYRRGANMAMLSLTHPDILKFIYAKQNLEAFTNFNISVKVTDRWMKELAKNPTTLHIVTNPRTGQNYLLPKKLDVETYDIGDLKETGAKPPANATARQFYTIGDIWKIIVKCAYATGEPGLAFIDRINKDNPIPSLGDIEATNPCGEQPLLSYEACTLGSINLTKFVVEQDGKKKMDWDGLAAAVKLAVRFLDNVIDSAQYPVRDTVKLAQANRKIGLGVMGFADTLFLLSIPYDSSKGIEFGEQLMSFINENAHKASAALAAERGPFPNWNESIWRTERNLQIRNASVTTIAPTGTISIIAGCSAGIEPLYSLIFKRRVLENKELIEINPVFKSVAEKNGFYTKRLQQQIAKSGSIQNIEKIPTSVRRIFKCAYDIKPDWHIQMQAVFQKHCDAAVSKTVNLPGDATIASVEKAFIQAYQTGCKGITIYRQGCRKLEPMILS